MNSLASLAMRLRSITQRPPAACKLLLEPLSQSEREAYVEYFESNGGSLFIDPVQLRPAVAPLLRQLLADADNLRNQGAFGKGMGSGGRLYAWIQAELKTRHGIEWKTPWEMNPDCAFD